jgi:hypothetical protein
LKKAALSVALVLTAFSIFAQKARVKNDPEYDEKVVHFGYTIGLNYMDFTLGRNFKYKNTDTVYADLSKPMPGFQVGIITDYRLGEYFNLRFLPGFNFGQRDLYFINNGKIINNKPVQLESSMLDFPLLLKYKAKRINNYRPYLLLGGSVRYDLASKKKFDEQKGDYILLKPFDYYFETGFGIDFYLPYFKFSTELKLCLGFSDVLNHKASNSFPQFEKSMTKLNSKIVMLNFHFE